MGADSAALTEVLGKRVPKTTKGRRILARREPQIVEGAKSALVIRGLKCSAPVQMFLRDMYVLRNNLATLFMRSHPYHPFEDVTRLEQLCNKHDHSLFLFGSSTKKRPFRVIFGRLFKQGLLDMEEYSISDYTSRADIGQGAEECMTGNKPLVVFQGAAFDSDERLKRTKSLLLDYFSGPRPEKVLLQGLEQVIVCTALDAPSKPGALSDEPEHKVQVRRYRVLMQKSGSRLPRVELKELGPRFTLSLDRSKAPDKELWKQSIKIPKEIKKKKEKNISKDTTGKKRARIHLGRQDFDQIHTVHHSKKKAKKLREDLQALKKESGGNDSSAPPGEA